MAIPVTTRSGKGAPLTPAEMDTNLTNLARDATLVQQGNVELATTAEATAGTSETLAVTPAGLQAGLDALSSDLLSNIFFSANQNGHIQFSDDFGNILINWGQTGSIVDGGSTTVTFSRPFVSTYIIVSTPTNTTGAHDSSANITSTTNATITHFDNSAGQSSTVNWIAIGTGATA